MSLHSALVHWTVDKRLSELLVSPMIENEVVDWLPKSLGFRHRKNDRGIPLHWSKYTSLSLSGRTFWQVHNSLILELTVKVIISVIVKYVEKKMQFCCSHKSHEFSQVLAIRLAAQHQVELILPLRARERIHACWARSQWWECLPSMKLNLLLPSCLVFHLFLWNFLAMVAASNLFSSRICVIFSRLFVSSFLTVYLFTWLSSVCCRWSLVKSYATWYKSFSTSPTYVLTYDTTRKM